MTGESFDIYSHLARAPNPGAYCLHCGGVAKASQHPELVLACNLCGAPRIPMPEEVPLDETAQRALKQAEAARKSRGLMRALFGIGLAGAAFGVLLAAPFAFLSGLASFMVLLFVTAPAIAMALVGRMRAQGKSQELQRSLDAAWGSAASELASAGKAKSPAELAKVLGIPGEKAAQLWTMLTVDAEIGGVTDDGQVRIADAFAPTSALPADPRFAALEAKAEQEAVAEEEADSNGHTKQQQERNN